MTQSQISLYLITFTDFDLILSVSFRNPNSCIIKWKCNEQQTEITVSVNKKEIPLCKSFEHSVYLHIYEPSPTFLNSDQSDCISASLTERVVCLAFALHAYNCWFFSEVVAEKG
ncbi:hypothetical protein XENOCAPTIV_026442 [Xenoophorus captivus]|uniref:Leptin receptor n=1 Tax=Xenoophorus captivus TaxID=1517983 RepID=A0ABV0SHF8_9TELE